MKRRKGGEGGREEEKEEEDQAPQDMVQTDPAIPPFPGFLLQTSHLPSQDLCHRIAGSTTLHEPTCT